LFFFVRQPNDVTRVNLLFLKICNGLLRRLSKTSNTAFAGQVSLHISAVCSVDDRSALNVMSKFNRANVTLYEQLPSEKEQGEAVAEGKEDAKMADDASAASSSRPPTPSTPTSTAAALAALPPAPLAAGGVDSTLYTSLWSLQSYFLDPQALKDTATLDKFTSAATKVLEAFESSTLNEKESLAAIVSSSGAALRGIEPSVFPKYLTGPRLLGLQLRDPSLRRNVLLQLLVFLAHVLNPAGNVDVMRDIVSGQNNAKDATAALAQTSVSGAFLPVPALPALRTLFSRALKSLKLTPPASAKFVDAFLLTLAREHRFWLAWKNDSAPSKERCAERIQREPFDAAELAKTIDVDALAQAERERRAALADPAGAAKAKEAAESRKRKASALSGAGGAKPAGFRGFAKPAPMSFEDDVPIRSESGRLFMGTDPLARLFAPADERNRDVLAFLRSSERAELVPNVQYKFIDQLIMQEEEAKERETAKKERTVKREERKAKRQAAKVEKKAAAKAAKQEATGVKTEATADAAMTDTVPKNDASDTSSEEEEEVDEQDAEDADADADDVREDAQMLKNQSRDVWQLLRLLSFTSSVEATWLKPKESDMDAVEDSEDKPAPQVSGLDLFLDSEGTAQKLLDSFVPKKPTPPPPTSVTKPIEPHAIDEAAAPAELPGESPVAAESAVVAPMEDSISAVKPVAVEVEAGSLTAPSSAEQSPVVATGDATPQ
jgi:hypothetical protein